jgi:rhodanese-related sulfurtransferase
MLDDPTLILLDARYGKDWRRSDRKIRNAERLDASEVDSWEGRYAPDQKIIIYCS